MTPTETFTMLVMAWARRIGDVQLTVRRWLTQTHPLRVLWLALILALTGGLLLGLFLFWMIAPARADVIQQCKTDAWGFLGGQRRELCDGPLHPDGSWMRQRIIYVPAHQVNRSCSTFGNAYSAFTNCSGGYFQPLTVVTQDVYPVTPGTVLPDEPGHLS